MRFNATQQSSNKANYYPIQSKERIIDDTSSEAEADSVEDLEEIKSDDENLASPFNEPNIVLVFDKRKLYLQKQHRIAVSPVF